MYIGWAAFVSNVLATFSLCCSICGGEFEEAMLHEETKNPFGPDQDSKDYEDWHKPVYRSSEKGILGTYKKQIGLTAKDVMQKDYWDNMLNL